MRPYTYIRAGSRTPTRAYVRPGLVYMAGSERSNCVVVVFMGRQRNASCSSGGNRTRGSQPAWTEQPMEMEETALCSTSHVRNGILLIGRGVAYRKTEETDLCWSATVETEVLFIGRGVAYHKMGLHGILFISTVDPLHPPRATVHPPLTSSSLHLRLFIHGLLFI